MEGGFFGSLDSVHMLWVETEVGVICVNFMAIDLDGALMWQLNRLHQQNLIFAAKKPEKLVLWDTM